MEDIKLIYSFFLGLYNYDQFLDKSPLFKVNELPGSLIKISDYEKFK